MTSPIDSPLFGHLFGTDEMRRIFSDEAKVQRWMDVEAALARAEASLGIIPNEHAQEISRQCDVRLIDMGLLQREFRRTRNEIMAMIHCYQAICEGSAGEYLHWGATTQDIVDTGLVLQLKDAHAVIRRETSESHRLLCKLALAHEGTLQAGRTQGQHAAPITFGFKVAVWADEIGRHLTRLGELASRVFQGQLGGAVGTLASLGEAGLLVQRHMFADLDLTVPEIAWHSARDRFAELVCTYAMIGCTLGKIASEVYDLQRTEIGELTEPLLTGELGSSTMPHKRNPSVSSNVPSLCKLLAAQVAPALAAMSVANERDSRSWHAEWSFLAETCCLLGAMLEQVNYVLRDINVNTQVMRRNLELTGGFILSESVMLSLGSRIGRQRAHELVHRLCMDAIARGSDLKASLLADPEIARLLSSDEMDRLLDPAQYTGLAALFVRRVAGRRD